MKKNNSSNLPLCCIDIEPYTENITNIEIDLLLNAVSQNYGYDFHNYDSQLLHRRLNIFRTRYQVKYFSELIPILLHNSTAMQQLIQILSITITDFFRDPTFFLSIKNQVIPTLRTYPFITVWCAGCATGEEAYSWAILLKEAGLLERSRIYATDINTDALQKASNGVYSKKKHKKAINNYLLSGGDYCFDHYCDSSSNTIKMAPTLKEHIIFNKHNLVHDSVFVESVVVSCRNVLIYFDSNLKQHCMALFYNSLCNQGFLCLGPNESLNYATENYPFETQSHHCRIFRKKLNSLEMTK